MEPRTRQVYVRMTDGEYDNTRGIASIHGVSVPGVIRMLIQKEVRRLLNVDTIKKYEELCIIDEIEKEY